jgi:orotate phosphoribosyltransferase-like protein
MSKEQVKFQKKQAEEMGQIQKIFKEGFAEIKQAKSIADEVGEEAEAEIETIQDQKKEEEAPTALVQVATQSGVEAEIEAQE